MKIIHAKYVLLNIFILSAILLFHSCRVYSWMVFENSEFPDNTLPTEIDTSIKSKYAVGDVIVKPRIVSIDGSMTTQKVFIIFFSENMDSEVSIKTFSLYINGVETQQGFNIVEKQASEWEMYPSNEPYYVCHISGSPIETLNAEMFEGEVHLSFVLSVKEKNGEFREKKIDANFVPKNRAYIE